MRSNNAHQGELVARPSSSANTDASTANGTSVFARIGHASAGRDWMPCLATDGVLGAAPRLPSPVLPPTPIAMGGDTTTSPAVASTGLRFLSRLYRGAGALSTPASRPAAVLPVDACLALDTGAAPVGVRMPQPIGTELTLPTPLGVGDTWNALGALPTTLSVRHPVAPASIDAVPTSLAGSRSFWTELPASGATTRNALSVLRTRKAFEAPTLEAFCRPVDEVCAAPPTDAPLPPQPLSVSPLRNAEATRCTARTAPGGEVAPLLPHPHTLRPIDAVVEDALGAEAVHTVPCDASALMASVALARQDEEQYASNDAHASAAVTAPDTCPVAPRVAATETAPPQPGTVQSFFGTLFAKDADEHATELLYHNALEIATNKPRKPVQRTDYSVFFNTSLFDDTEDEDSDFSLEQLRDVLNSVLQNVKTDELPSSKGNVGGAERAAEARSGRYTEYASTFSSRHDEWAHMSAPRGPLFQ